MHKKTEGNVSSRVQPAPCVVSSEWKSLLTNLQTSKLTGCAFSCLMGPVSVTVRIFVLQLLQYRQKKTKVENWG
jgi:hypothetical protein